MRKRALVGIACAAFALVSIGACGVAYAEPLESAEPVVSECNEYSNGAPDACVCLSEDRVLDAAAELKVCRNKPVISFDQMTWLERALWVAVAAAGVVLL